MKKSGKAVSSQSGSIPFETVKDIKRGLLWPIPRKKNLISLHSAAFVTICVYIYTQMVTKAAESIYIYIA